MKNVLLLAAITATSCLANAGTIIECSKVDALAASDYSLQLVLKLDENQKQAQLEIYSQDGKTNDKDILAIGRPKTVNHFTSLAAMTSDKYTIFFTVGRSSSFQALGPAVLQINNAGNVSSVQLMCTQKN
ncbi:MAG: hypothetical protein ACOYOK_02895 [Pseudobdellovibrionaceae bacterium]